MKIAFLTLTIAILLGSQFTAKTEQSEREMYMKKAQFNVQHTLLSQLGEEHISHAVLRRETKGDNIVAWGERILQWRLAEGAKMEEVFPPVMDLQYSNGGCAMDVDGDEIQLHKFAGMMNTHVSYWTIE